MKVMACDIASTSGFALDGPDGKPRGITFKLPGGGNDLGLAGLAFSEFMHGVASMQRPDVIAIEAPVLGNGGDKVFTSELLIGLAFIAEVVASSLSIRTVRGNVQTVRKAVLGRGRPDDPKRAVIAHCRAQGWGPKNDNEADAMVLWKWTKNQAPAKPLFAAGDA